MSHVEIEQFKTLYAVAQTMDTQGTDVADRYATEILLALGRLGDASFQIREFAKELSHLNATITYLNNHTATFHKNFEALKEFVR